jgi:hypothetical protein
MESPFFIFSKSSLNLGYNNLTLTKARAMNFNKSTIFLTPMHACEKEKKNKQLMECNKVWNGKLEVLTTIEETSSNIPLKCFSLIKNCRSKRFKGD